MDIFPSIPDQMPPILITQHMPAGFTKSFAARLDRVSGLHVKEGEPGDELKPNRVFVAPGHAHMMVESRGVKRVLAIDEGLNVCGHRPSVDKLFRSVAQTCGSNCTAIIMTGMGNDGAQAIGDVRKRGGLTIAQDQESSIVYGMPKAAAELDHVDRVLSLQAIVPALIESFSVPV